MGFTLIDIDNKNDNNKASNNNNNKSGNKNPGRPPDNDLNKLYRIYN